MGEIRSGGPWWQWRIAGGGGRQQRRRPSLTSPPEPSVMRKQRDGFMKLEWVSHIPRQRGSPLTRGGAVAVVVSPRRPGRPVRVWSEGGQKGGGRHRDISRREASAVAKKLTLPIARATRGFRGPPIGGGCCGQAKKPSGIVKRLPTRALTDGAAAPSSSLGVQAHFEFETEFFCSDSKNMMCGEYHWLVLATRSLLQGSCGQLRSLCCRLGPEPSNLSCPALRRRRSPSVMNR